MTVAVTNGASKDVDDLYGDRFTVALAQAMTRLECAPYWHSGEKAPARLVRAGELVRLSRVQLHDERTATVHGSTKPYDITGFHCTCPQSQKGQTHWCVHAVAVKLARTMAAQAPLPQDDEPLPLPIGPTSVDERLAQAAMDAVSHARETHHTPQEDRMADDAYIPEPETNDAPVAVLEAPVSTRALTPVAPQVLDLEMALQTWTTERAVVRRFLKQELQANIDYYTLRIGGKDSKPSLSKAGAEKVMGWLKLQASFTPDTGTWEMLGKPQDLVCYVCTLRTRSGEIVGEGRGARSIKKDGGDVNKAIKMAEKSANVSAVLRTGCLSDVFTSDLEDMQDPDPAKPTTPAKPTSQDLRARIWHLVKQADATVTTREACAAFVHARTGYVLEPDNYGAIVRTLEEGR
jgi:hypothetical protein